MCDRNQSIQFKCYFLWLRDQVFLPLCKFLVFPRTRNKAQMCRNTVLTPCTAMPPVKSREERCIENCTNHSGSFLNFPKTSDEPFPLWILKWKEYLKSSTSGSDKYPNGFFKLHKLSSVTGPTTYSGRSMLPPGGKMLQVIPAPPPRPGSYCGLRLQKLIYVTPATPSPVCPQIFASNSVSGKKQKTQLEFYFLLLNWGSTV